MIFKILIATASMAGISTLLSILLVIAERYLANYGDCKVTINDEKEFVVKGGSSLLSSLSSQKIFLPSACGGRGTCAYCKCKVLEGIGAILPTEEPLLSPEERENNIRLSCQIKVKQDMKIEIPEELFNIKEFKTRVAFIKDLTHDIKLIRFDLIEPNEIKFKAGQYVQLEIQPYNDVQEVIQRAYSMSSPAYEKNYVELMIRLVPEGICTTWVFKHLKEGDTVRIIGPMGDFHLHDGNGEIIMVAGGSGMAPMVSLLADMAKNKIIRKTTYFFGALAKKDMFYLNEMEEFEKQIPNFKFVPALSAPQPDDEWDGEVGLITAPLENYLKKIDNAKTQGYLCGSPGMINACVAIMKKYGIASERIFFDPFG
ncbi:MAG: 2Fe-2S iron-sulfur cluster binding domain-containing protein [bacterium]|nr:MAG: 2Fe-2S iron-sulfur cluster binding domain-containing protein [bacterium]